MKCLNCGATLSEKDYCTSCGENVAIYKKIIRLANLYYNDGLEKANVRDLSGAVISLKRCLKFNKEHIMARNLLGLVYFEIGETVAALSQWIISTNIQSENNAADDYIKLVQSNQGRLDAINQTIRKYNLALEYCRQNSEDLAIIQLKKVLSVNSHLVQGYQLLALLYIRQEEYEKAYNQLKKAIKIDSSNTITLHYMRELKGYEEQRPQYKKSETKVDPIKVLDQSKDKIAYKNGNEMIIQPTNIKDNNGFWIVVNILVGLVVGAALMWFLGAPASIQQVKNEYKKKENANYEQLQAKNAEIDSLNAKLDNMNSQLDDANSNLAAYTGEGGQITNLENLAEAERIYINGDISAAFDVLVKVDKNSLSDKPKAAWQMLYDNSIQSILKQALKLYSSQGKSQDAIALYQKILSVDPANEEALYHCGNAYRKNNQNAEAINMFNTLLQNAPNGKYASKAKSNLDKLQQQ